MKMTPPTKEQVQAAREIGAARMAFAFGLKDRMAARLDKENFCISPLSVNLCLSMLLNGAAGQTKADLAKTLSLGSTDVGTVNDGNYTLVSALRGDSFSCANSVWTHSKVDPTAAFKSTLESYYRAEAFSVPDFEQATVDRVNQWTSDQTKGRIDHLFSHFDRSTCLVLVNALTFDGKWAKPFKREVTQDDDFHLPAGGAVKVPMMHQVDHFRYGGSAGAAALQMVYMGSDFSMVFILPPESVSAKSYLETLSAASFQKLMAGMREEEVDVAIPKFEFRGNYDLVPPLQSMGMGRLFIDADFSGISPTLGPGSQTYVSQVVHQTYIKVFEEGTEAAAATGLGAATGAAPSPDPPKQFHANRPFLFALIHNETGSIVFFGLVEKP